MSTTARGTAGRPLILRRRPAAVDGPTGHIPALDGVRGLAILLVMVRHFTFLMRPESGADRVALFVGQQGWIGVDLFFVLSGCLITGILCDAKGSGRYFTNFYVRRALRIFPLYYASLVGLFMIVPRLPGVLEALPALDDRQAWYWLYAANILIAREGAQATSIATGHFWSLAVEEQFYLVWPLLVWLASRRQLLWLCLAAMAAAPALRVLLWALGVEATASYVLTPTRLDALAAGGLVAVIVRDAALRAWFTARLGALATGAALLVLALLAVRGGLDYEDPLVSTAGFSLIALAFGVLVLAGATAAPESRTARFLSRAELRSLGKYSYALYIFHYPVAMALLLAIGGPAAVPVVAGSRLPGQIGYMIAGLAVSLGMAWLSWQLFERHFLRLKVFFEPQKGIR